MGSQYRVHSQGRCRVQSRRHWCHSPESCPALCRGVNLHHLIVIDMTRDLPEEMKHKRLGGDQDGEKQDAPVARFGVGEDLPVIHSVTYRNISASGIDSDAFKIKTLPQSPVNAVVMDGVHAGGNKAQWKCKGGPLHGTASDVSPPPPKECFTR